jgi:hypothetical protein
VSNRREEKRLRSQKRDELSEARRLSFSSDLNDLMFAHGLSSSVREYAESAGDGKLSASAAEIQQFVLPRLHQLGRAACETVLLEGIQAAKEGDASSARQKGADAMVLFLDCRLGDKEVAAANQPLMDRISELGGEKSIVPPESATPRTYTNDSIGRARECLDWADYYNAWACLLEAVREAEASGDKDKERIARELLNHPGLVAWLELEGGPAEAIRKHEAREPTFPRAESHSLYDDPREAWQQEKLRIHEQFERMRQAYREKHDSR